MKKARRRLQKNPIPPNENKNELKKNVEDEKHVEDCKKFSLKRENTKGLEQHVEDCKKTSPSQ